LVDGVDNADTTITDKSVTDTCHAHQNATIAGPVTKRSAIAPTPILISPPLRQAARNGRTLARVEDSIESLLEHAQRSGGANNPPAGRKTSAQGAGGAAQSREARLEECLRVATVLLAEFRDGSG
jgi:hypothetical protein